jgi:uncharacterized repeat protein (TIGR01451 family)
MSSRSSMGRRTRRAAIGLLAAAALMASGSLSAHHVHADSTAAGPPAASIVASGPAQVGSPVTLTVTATNTTGGDLNELTILAGGTIDTVTNAAVPFRLIAVQPAGLTCIHPLNECIFSGTVAPGTSIVATITITPTSLDTLTTTAAAIGGIPLGQSGTAIISSTVDLTTPVSPGPTDVQVTGSASTGSPARGATYSYTFQVKNNGPLPAYVVTFSDPLPAAVGFAGVQTTAGTCSQATGTVSCSLGDLAVGAQANVVITVTAPASPATFTNTASVASASPDRQPANNSVGVSVQVK